MKRIISFIIILALLPCIPAHGADVSAKAAIVLEPNTGAVLYEKNAHEPMLIASTTKIMTALVVLENCALDKTVPVTAEHTGIEGSSAHLKAGESYTVEELLCGLLLSSGNDAAAALADHCAGSMSAFAEMMNSRAQSLGLRNTNFENAHGLDGEEHYSSAADLAAITAEAMKNPDFCRIFGAERMSFSGRSYKNHNKLLSFCPGCIGGKTGYTKAAGRVLVSCVEREGMRLICVTISDPRDWDDHMALYDECFAAYEYIPIPELSIPVISGMADSVNIIPATPGFVAPGSGAELTVHLPPFVFAPIVSGKTAGWAELRLPDGTRERIELLYAASVPTDPAQRLTLREKIFR